MNIIDIIVSILVGLATAIPAVYYLVLFVRKAIREKNWTVLMEITMKLMAQAEQNYKTGAERKEWVMSEIKALQPTLNFELDEEAISALIDSICDAARAINKK